MRALNREGGGGGSVSWGIAEDVIEPLAKIEETVRASDFYLPEAVRKESNRFLQTVLDDLDREVGRIEEIRKQKATREDTTQDVKSFHRDAWKPVTANKYLIKIPTKMVVFRID